MTAVPETMRTDFATVLSEAGQTVTIVRPTHTKGSLGDVISSSKATYNIPCIIQPITDKDRDIHSMGLAEPGNEKVFFKHIYTPSDDADITDTFTPDVGDLVTDERDVTEYGQAIFGIDHLGANEAMVYRIIQIVSKARHQNDIVFVKAVVRRLE